ncbi:MAG: DUF4838 domain-containing protein [Verrucomicrobia bacterium]|nr:DUF4838 domain-containing protein [Verrucomicrobiota bacterium]
MPLSNTPYARITWWGVLLAAALSSSAGAITIAKDGSSTATIVVGEGSSEAVRHAARELQFFLKEVTGAELPLAAKGKRGSPRILVGPQAARMADARFATEALGTEGLVIRTVGRDLILSGGEPRGTLYAVYTFLEDYVGCHWWATDASTIPRQRDLKFEKLDVRYVPPFDYREPNWDTAMNRDWAVRNKVFGLFIPLDAETGGRPVIAAPSHSFLYQIPASRYFQSHPEWFSEVDGKRIPEGGQLCLSNEELRREMTRVILEGLRGATNPTHVSIAQNDGGRPCQCAKCRAMDAEEGSPAGGILRLVNAVGEEVAKEFPKVLISTFAYTYSQPAPKFTRPRDNVVVWLCTMGCSYNLPLAEHKKNAGFARDLADWGKIARHLYIWDYTTNFRHYLFIHPNLRVLGPNLRFFLTNHVSGVFEQGATGTPGAEFAELRSWVLAKLLWNPHLDDRKLVDQFLAGYYGPAGEHIGAYINLIHDTMQAGLQSLGCYEQPDRRFMKFETLSKAWSHMQAAERAVSDSPVLLKRVKLAQMPMMYAFMIRWADLRKQAAKLHADWPMPDDPRQVLADFKARAAAIGITRVSELETFDKLEANLKLP